jgi:acetylornithine deacetylase/succinyl-diaminopimelate desuccinylase-like protein
MAGTTMNQQDLRDFVEHTWDEDIVPRLAEYVGIPCKSPAFDEHWQSHGEIDRAVSLAENWCREQDIPGATIEVVQLENRTPVLLMDIPGDGEGCVLLYGHLDKQPEMEGWRDDLGPWKPVIEDERLYGRGGADDGYAVFASVTAVRALQRQSIPHARCIVLIETCEESGSYDLPHYLDALAPRIGHPDLVVCLDSGCGNYEQLWNTTSLRGLVIGELRVEILREGVHSGDAGGIVPSSFRIIRQLLGRLEDERSGDVLPLEFHASIPDRRRQQAHAAAEVLGESVYRRFPFTKGSNPQTPEPEAAILARSWRPALAVTGAGGLPPMDAAGNVLRPGTRLKLSLRLPPSIDAGAAADQLKALLESKPPHGARVSFDHQTTADGWHAPALSPWLESAMEEASQMYFCRPAMHMGEGGSIPFMQLLGEKYPQAQFLITGVLGPGSNAHGPNEFLHLPMGKGLTCCVAHVIARHYEYTVGAEG